MQASGCIGCGCMVRGGGGGAGGEAAQISTTFVGPFSMTMVQLSR